MILQLPGILRRIVPNVVRDVPMSIVRIHTTRPVYMVFLEPGGPGPVPQAACAVQFGPRKEMVRVREALATLHAFLPETVPDAVACSMVGENNFALVQQVMPGAPWFRTRCDIHGVAEWMAFRQRSRHTLSRLHDAIRRRRQWRVQVHLGRELAHYAIAATRNGLLSAELCDRLQRTAAGAACRTVHWFFQHGDYCINNLLVAGDRIGVIDFEEFGQTAMPLHDEFSLALSFHEFMTGVGGAPTLDEHVAACVRPTLALSPELEPLLQPLFLHHLLWRINQCGGRPTRAAIRDELIGLLERTLQGGESVSWARVGSAESVYAN